MAETAKWLKRLILKHKYFVILASYWGNDAVTIQVLASFEKKNECGGSVGTFLTAKTK